MKLLHKSRCISCCSLGLAEKSLEVTKMSLGTPSHSSLHVTNLNEGLIHKIKCRLSSLFSPLFLNQLEICQQQVVLTYLYIISIKDQRELSCSSNIVNVAEFLYAPHSNPAFFQIH